MGLPGKTCPCFLVFCGRNCEVRRRSTAAYCFGSYRRWCRSLPAVEQPGYCQAILAESLGVLGVDAREGAGQIAFNAALQFVEVFLVVEIAIEHGTIVLGRSDEHRRLAAELKIVRVVARYNASGHVQPSGCCTNAGECIANPPATTSGATTTLMAPRTQFGVAWWKRMKHFLECLVERAIRITCVLLKTVGLIYRAAQADFFRDSEPPCSMPMRGSVRIAW